MLSFFIFQWREGGKVKAEPTYSFCLDFELKNFVRNMHLLGEFKLVYKRPDQDELDLINDENDE